MCIIIIDLLFHFVKINSLFISCLLIIFNQILYSYNINFLIIRVPTYIVCTMRA